MTLKVTINNEDLPMMNNTRKTSLLCQTFLMTLVASFSAHANEIPEIVDTHNKERAINKLPPLTWSPTLATYAQQWADHLAKNKHCNLVHRPLSGAFAQKHGENLYWGGPITWTNGKVELQKLTGKKVVQDWISEKQYFNIRINQCFPGQQCGHYTQVVWKATKQVGCAKAICGDKSQVWVCNYNPPGNYVGQRPF